MPEPRDLKQKMLEALRHTVSREVFSSNETVSMRYARAEESQQYSAALPKSAHDTEDERPLELDPTSDQALENGQSIYSILSESGTHESSEEALEMDRKNMPEDLIMANLRLERELQAMQKDRRLNPSFEGETTSAPDKINTNSEFGGTLALNGVMSNAPTGVPESSQEITREPEEHQVSKLRTGVSPVVHTQNVKLTKSVLSGGSMADLSGYKDLSQAPFSMGETRDEYASMTHPESEISGFDRPQMGQQSTFSSPAAPFPEMNQEVDTEFSGNVKTLIRLVNELPDGVTKQTGAQIIRLTMEAMGISMEDVLSEAQSAQSEMLDAVRANIKKIEEYKTVIRKLETDIRYYQGKANELSEIIDLFILSNTSSNKMPSVDDLPH